MGFEGPPARPPIPPKAEKPPEPVVQPETPVAEVQQEVAPDAVQETIPTEVAEVPVAEAPMAESPQEVAQQPATEQTAEKTAEEVELEQLNTELQTRLETLRENQKQREAIAASVEAILSDKRYERKVSGGEVEDVLAALIPNRNVGIENYKRIIDALPDDPYYRDRPKKVLRILEGMSDEQVKNMVSAFDFQNNGITAPRYDYVDYDDLAKVTGSEAVRRTVSQFNRSIKEIQSIREQKDNNPEIIALDAQSEALSKKDKSDNEAVDQLEAKIKTIENAKASATPAS